MSNPERSRQTEGELHTRERDEFIRERRARAFPDSPPTDAPPNPSGNADLVGLALSGGGVRSAAFNLGLLQSLHKAGVLRFVDYLSAVSGGSYVAGMFAAAVSRSGLPYNLKNGNQCGFSDSTHQPQLGRIRRLVANGNYLFRLDRLLNSYLIGFVLNLIPRLAFLFAIGAGLAFLWRCLDYHWVRDRFTVLNLPGDVAPAVAPACLFGLAWCATWVMGLWLQSAPLKRFSWWLLMSFLAAVPIAIAVLIGNGDIGATAFGDLTHQQNLRGPLLAIIGLGLVPILRPKQLLHSGVSPRRKVDSWVFYYTSFALLMGVPLVIVGVFARENISGFGTQRGPQLEYGDLIQQPHLFARWVANPPWNPDRIPSQDLLKLQASLQTAIDEREGIKDELIGIPHWYRPRPERAAPTATQPESAGSGDDLSFSAMQRNWSRWKYSDWFRPWCFFGEYLAESVIGANTQNLTRRYMDAEASIRDIERSLRASVNDELLGTRKSALITASELVQYLEAVADKEGAEAERLKERLSAKTLKDLLIPYKADSSPNKASLTNEKLGELNRMLLEAGFPDWIRSRSSIRRATVIEHDQWHRLLWCIGAAVVFLVSALIVNPNVTALHEYYRDQLGGAFLEDDRSRPLSQITPWQNGAPYLLLQGAVATRRQFEHARQLYVEFESYLLSPGFCGSSTLGYQPTSELVAPRDLSIADAMAASGAAVSPSYFVQHIVMLVLNVLNLRQGLWLPTDSRGGDSRVHPSFLGTGWNTLTRDLADRKWVLVSDGGHAENLGLAQLLDRRCRLMIVSDASQDGDCVFSDFARLIQTYRLNHGIEFFEAGSPIAGYGPAGAPLNLHGRFVPRTSETAGDAHAKFADYWSKLQSGNPRRHFFVAKVAYPHRGEGTPTAGESSQANEALVLYIKPTLTGDEDADIYNYASQNGKFPHDKTSDQAFSSDQFEAYRRLGFHTGEDLCAALGNAQTSLWDERRFDASLLIERLLGQPWPATDRAAGTGAATTAHQATPHEPPANEKCTNDATGNGAAPGDPRVADRSGPSRQTPEQGPNRDAGKPVNARSLASQLHELFEVDLRLEDMLVQEIKKQRSRRKHPLELVRALRLLGSMCHSRTYRELARLLVTSDAGRDLEFMLAVVDVLATSGSRSKEVHEALNQLTAAGYPPTLQEAARNALQQLHASNGEKAQAAGRPGIRKSR